MITSDIELFKLISNFRFNIPVFRDLAKDRTKSPYIVYSSLNSQGIHGSGKVIAKVTEYEILLIQKNKNDISLKNSFAEYLMSSNINITNQTETTSVEEADEYYFLNIYIYLIVE